MSSENNDDVKPVENNAERFCPYCNSKIELTDIKEQHGIKTVVLQHWCCNECWRISGGYFKTEKEIVQALQQRFFKDDYYYIESVLQIIRRHCEIK